MPSSPKKMDNKLVWKQFWVWGQSYYIHSLRESKVKEKTFMAGHLKTKVRNGNFRNNMGEKNWWGKREKKTERERERGRKKGRERTNKKRKRKRKRQKWMRIEGSKLGAPVGGFYAGTASLVSQLVGVRRLHLVWSTPSELHCYSGVSPLQTWTFAPSRRVNVGNRCNNQRIRPCALSLDFFLVFDIEFCAMAGNLDFNRLLLIAWLTGINYQIYSNGNAFFLNESEHWLLVKVACLEWSLIEVTHFTATDFVNAG